MAFKLSVLTLVLVVVSSSEALEFKIDLHNFTQLSLAVNSLYSTIPCPLSIISKHYTEMSCPIASYRNATFLNCPKEYDCSAVDQRSEASCLYKNKSYPVGSSISNKVLNVRCKSKCICQLNDNGVAEFDCQTQECPTPKKGCRLQFKDHQQCCPDENCNTLTPKKKNCKFAGKWFAYGETIFNNFNQTRCLCQKGFDGTMNGKWCQKVDCGVELNYRNTIGQGCAPVYEVNVTGIYELVEEINGTMDFTLFPPLETVTSLILKGTSHLLSVCPLSWICPSDDDVLIPAMTVVSILPDIDPTTKCFFGYNDLALLDILMTPELEDGSCAVCTCLMPPVLSCVRKIPCWTF